MIQGLGVFPALLAALILRTDRRLVHALLDANATSSGTAIALDTNGALGHWRLERLIRKGAIQTADSVHFYINELAWQRYQKARRRRLVTVVILMVPLLLLLFWWGTAEGIVGELLAPAD